MRIPEPWCLPLFLGGKKGAWVEGFAPPVGMKKLTVSYMKALVPLFFLKYSAEILGSSPS